MPENGRKIHTVSEVNGYVRQMLESVPLFGAIYIRGEIGNITFHKSGHVYFTLKDEESALRAVLFRSCAASLLFRPETGMRVICFGRVTSYLRDGCVQLIAERIEPDGIGALAAAFEQLKEKLNSEGLFREENKKTLPLFPKRIGVITSRTGAAVRDVIRVCRTRFPLTELVIYPSLVQGKDAPAQLISGIEYFNREKTVDLILLTRGGGSMEDLWAFNDEKLARTIAASSLPLISAVGHETDFTIADFVADVRAATPSNGAEIALPDAKALRRRLTQISRTVVSALKGQMEAKRETVSRIASRRVLASPLRVIDDRRMTLINLEKRLWTAEKNEMNGFRASFREISGKLNALSPLAVLSRGYAAAFFEGKILKSIRQIEIGDTFLLRLTDGQAEGKVVNKYGEKDGNKRKERDDL